MRLEGFPSVLRPFSGGGARATCLLAALLVPGALAVGASTDEATGSDTNAEVQDDRNPDSSTDGGAQVAGSLSIRSSLREGAGNDRFSSRLGLEWAAERWSGGFTAEFENATGSGGIFAEEGLGSFDLPERWVTWTNQGPQTSVELRLGTSFGLRFAEGLVLGSASFEGLAARVDRDRWQLTALAGRSETLDPTDFYDEPPTLFDPDEEFLGNRGELLGARVAVQATDGLVLGVNALQARADGSPWVLLGSVDFAWNRGGLDLSGEFASRDGGGSAAYLRGDWSPSDLWGLGFEHRRYDDFVSPVGNAPLYSGLSAGSERDEEGLLLRLDLMPTERFSASVAFDYSAGGGKDDAGLARVRRAHRLELDYLLSERTSLSYGLEFENTAGGDDGVIHSMLVTHSFVDGGRLSGRLQVDGSSAGTRSTMRVNYRRPFFNRRLTLLVDDSLRRSAGHTMNTLQLGASVKLGGSSHLTVRGTLADGEANGLDLTWYRRF